MHLARCNAAGGTVTTTTLTVRRPPALARSLARATATSPVPAPPRSPLRAPPLERRRRRRPLAAPLAATAGDKDNNNNDNNNDKDKDKDNNDSTTRLARLAAEAVASPIFYLAAGLLAVRLVASTGERAPAILFFAALPVTLLTALSKSPLGASVQASLEARLPQLEAEAGARRRAAAEARRASPFFGARRPTLPPSVGGGRAPWLDGSLAGDYGFDPLGFSAPDGSGWGGALFAGGGAAAAENEAASATRTTTTTSNTTATATATTTTTTTTQTTSRRADALAPPANNPALARLAEAELLHARWAMLGALGCLVPEALSVLAHVDVGPEPRWWAVGGAKLRGDFELNWGGIKGLRIAGKQGVGVIALCQLFLMGGPEYARQVGIKSLEPVGVFLPGDELYPGGAPFDPLGLADADGGAAFARLATSEVRHGRVAMVAMLGYGFQAALTRKGPVENLLDFAADPAKNNLWGVLTGASPAGSLLF